MVCKNLGKVYACCVQKSRKGELFRNECQMGYSLYPYCNGYIGQALFSSLKLRSEGLAAATLARCANVTVALIPTAPARLHISLQGLPCFACSPFCCSCTQTRSWPTHNRLTHKHPSSERCFLPSHIRPDKQGFKIQSGQALFSPRCCVQKACFLLTVAPERLRESSARSVLHAALFC